MCELGFCVAQRLDKAVNVTPREGWKEVHMRHSLEQIVLECKCGKRTVLLGTEDDWRSRRAIFKCECGQNLTLDDHVDEEALVAS
jgi:hypothetical protein